MERWIVELEEGGGGENKLEEMIGGGRGESYIHLQNI